MSIYSAIRSLFSFGPPRRDPAWKRAVVLVVVFAGCVAQSWNRTTLAQSPQVDFVSAIDLIPNSAAGVVRVPDLPDLCAAGKRTHLGQLIEDPLMKPFIDAQRDRAQEYLDSVGARIGLRPQDLYDIASGEVVAAWLPFEKDQRRPFAVCVVADIRQRQDVAQTTLNKIDADLKAGNAERVDRMHGGQTVRVYTTKPKPGQIKIEQVAITLTQDRVIAADRDTVIFDLLDAIAGSLKSPPISSVPEYQTVMKKSRDQIEQSDTEGAAEALQWFARPFPMGRILRKSMNVDRGNQVDILRLLENQGFDAIKAAGGIVYIGGETLDILHRGYVLAPPTGEGDSRYKLAAAMLQFSDKALEPIPAWIPQDAASFTRLHWNIERAVWASETLINEAFGDEIFQGVLEGIRDDEEGPQIDLEKNVLPNLSEEILIVTDNTTPSTIDSERMLVAIEVKNFKAIQTAVKKMMEVEPDATLLSTVPGVEIWQVQRTGETEDFDSEFLSDFGFEEAAPRDDAPPLLEHWAIAVVDKSAGNESPYLIFSSHADLLTTVLQRMQQANAVGLGSEPEVTRVMEAMKELGADTVAMDRVVRMQLSLRTKYELLREGRLKESDSVLASLVKRLFEDQEDANAPEPTGAKLPPLNQVEQHFPAGGGFMETTADGMTLNGLILK